MSNFARRVRRGGGVDALRMLNTLKPHLRDGYRMSDFRELIFGGFRAYVWKDGVFPPPDSAVRARVEIADNETRRSNIKDIIRLRAEKAMSSCDELIAKREKISA